MRWIQARDENGQPTMNALATVETIAAVGVSFWVVWHVGLAPLVIGATLAPLLLLRSERSMAMGLRAFKKLSNMCEPETLLAVALCIGLVCGGVVLVVTVFLSLFGRAEFLELLDSLWPTGELPSAAKGLLPLVIIFLAMLAGLIGIIVMLIACASAVFGVRVACTLISLATHPIESISVVPVNWKRVALSENVWVVLEIVPGVNADTELRDRFSVVRYISTYREHAREGLEGYLEFGKDAHIVLILYPILMAILSLGGVAALFLLYVPALLYRFSLKSTSYLYLLLLGVIGVLYGKYRVFGDAPADERLGHASGDRTSLVFGLVTFGYVLVLPIVVMSLARMAGARLPAMPERFAFVADFFTMHPTFGWSNVMQLANAALAVLTLPVAWLAVRRPRIMGVADHGVRLMVFTRGLLTVGLILWFLAVLWHRVGWDGLAEFVSAVVETIRGVRFDPSLPGPVPSEPVA